MDIKCTVEREIATLDGGAKELRLVAWNDRPAKLDIRPWRETKDGEIRPGQGITLSDEEAKDLLEALQKYFDEQGAGAA